MRDFGITAEQFAATLLTAACQHYTSYLVATAWSAPYPVAVAALLPCFWIYAEVGRDIHARSVAGNPYQAWIATYADEEFHAWVRAFCAWTVWPTRRRPPRAPPCTYRGAARLEWMFWDSAYRLAQWPMDTAELPKK